MGAMGLNPEEIKKELDNLSRGPFMKVLAEVLASAPSMDDMSSFASRNPDRWGQLLAIVAKLGGYTDRLEVEGNVRVRVEKMSDLEIKQRLLELEGAVDGKQAIESGDGGDSEGAG